MTMRHSLEVPVHIHTIICIGYYRNHFTLVI